MTHILSLLIATSLLFCLCLTGCKTTIEDTSSISSETTSDDALITDDTSSDSTTTDDTEKENSSKKLRKSSVSFYHFCYIIEITTQSLLYKIISIISTGTL